MCLCFLFAFRCGAEREGLARLEVRNLLLDDFEPRAEGVDERARREDLLLEHALEPGRLLRLRGSPLCLYISLCTRICTRTLGHWGLGEGA